MKKEQATTAGRVEVIKRVHQLRSYESSHPELKHYSLQDLEKRMLASEVRDLALRNMNAAYKKNDSKAMKVAKLTNQKMVAEIRTIDAKYGTR